jgi:predicted PurR-regulated permease PerM
MSWEIALIIFLVITVFIVLLLPLVLELRTTLKKISSLVDNLNKDLPEILHNIKNVSEHTTLASERLHAAVGDIVEFEQKISKQIKEPVLEATTTIAAIIRALQAFLSYFLQKRKQKN